MSLSFTIEDIHKEDFLRQVEAEKVYQKILKNCSSEIKRAHRTFRQNYTYYIIPKVLPAEPNYDFYACAVYLINKLRKAGFYVRLHKENHMIISWVNKNLQQQKSNNYKRVLIENEITKKIIYNNANNNQKRIKYE